ncbi:sulfotransferase ssu-1-like [Dermacentor andersoni]|uniref:sulfotransferase ssu-1-like n=1 Tax=Dermacentor andersoni TaxID=34620 RepID=UPI00215535C8|nr:sulfotransferase ssu-1-like [Dermacentor andersoni]
MPSSKKPTEEETGNKDLEETCKPGPAYTNVYRDFEGLYLCYSFTDRNMRSALSYKPLDGDVFVVSYPKCGTTWMQYIVYGIFRDGVPPANLTEFMSMSPFLELVGAESAQAMPRPNAIKTHLPFNKQPYSAKAKYVYITRNPYDCCVSYYYHTRDIPMYRFEDGTFDQFFDMFVEGKVEFGDYFDHLLSWYEHRGDSNVLFVTYEDLKKDTRGWVLKIADFLGKEYGDKLRQSPDIFERIMASTSVDSMKKINAEMNDWSKDLASVPLETLPEGVKSFVEAMGNMLEKPFKGEFVRKGIVGDWQNHLSPGQVARMKERIALKTAGSDVMELWKDVGLP